MTENNIVELKTYRYSIDWSYEEKVKINLDDYVFFECEYRCDSWHLIGFKYDRKAEKWTSKELSAHWCFERDIAEFIYKANKYARAKTVKAQGCKISRFNNLHYSDTFYKSLQTILSIVDRMEEADQKTEKGGAAE